MAPKTPTIQKEGGLRAIAENGHVISSKKGAFDIGRNDGGIIPVPDGIGNASTFPGFCNTHDAMFSPAEQKIVPLSREVAFLLSYRAISLEKVPEGKRSTVKRASDRGYIGP
jgi:hypothetical protein